jgi:hypothetical protein
MPIRALNDTGLSVTEACSLYLSRAWPATCANARGCSAGAPTLRFDATAPPAPKGRRLPLRSYSL